MATAKKAAQDIVSLDPADPAAPRPRLHKLIVKNFRSIGAEPVAIELDDIVVLVGPNTAGKSSILRAYDVVMKNGSSEGKLNIEDFPNGQVVADALPEVELHTIIFDNAPGERWIYRTPEGEALIREQWIWSTPNANPQRRGFDVIKGDWDDNVPWGAPNVANARRPHPHRIDAFASPDVQAKEILELLLDVLKEKWRGYKSAADQEKSDYEYLLERIAQFQIAVVASAETETKKIEEEISALLQRVFPKHRIRLDAKPEADLEKSYSPFKAAADLLMGPADGYLSKVSQQGSGARRTLLWTTLRYLSEARAQGSTRPHVLLLDEPEMCLHPSAIREAREVLYGLPETKNWQVMITTHSPVFIDLSKDNTTVIRVQRNQVDTVASTTLYRPSRAKLDEEDRANLKALNACDPYVHEFFFGGSVIVVEGDTEYTAFALLKSRKPEKYGNLHVVRARGKGSILTVLKILNQFSTSYAVLHDADTPKTSAGKGNPAWGVNASIRGAVEASSAAATIRHVVSLRDFETALFGAQASSEKPWNAHLQISQDADVFSRAELLLDALIDGAQPLPSGFHRWTSIEELEALVS